MFGTTGKAAWRLLAAVPFVLLLGIVGIKLTAGDPNSPFNSIPGAQTIQELGEDAPSSDVQVKLPKSISPKPSKSDRASESPSDEPTEAATSATTKAAEPTRTTSSPKPTPKPTRTSSTPKPTPKPTPTTKDPDPTPTECTLFDKLASKC